MRLYRNRPTCIPKHLRSILCIAACLLCQINLTAHAQEQAAQRVPLRVLFVGNSYTYVNNLPQVVAALAKDKSISLIARNTAAGGATLKDHLNGKKKLQTVKLIDEGDYVAVVLQDQSQRPMHFAENTIKDIGVFCERIRQSGATPYLFVTWARESAPQTQAALTKTYEQAARIHNAKLVPVGPAWELARKLNPAIRLYQKDGSHPSELGTYLAACVFFAVLTGESPQGLVNNPKAVNGNGNSVVLMRIEKADAEFCQRVAEEAVRKYKSVPDAAPHADQPRR